MTPSEARGILGLSHEAGLDDLQKAYKKRSQFMHPDRFGDRPEGEIRFATAEFQRLTNARDVLREHLSRATDSQWDDSSHPSSGQHQETGNSAPATHITAVIPRDQAFAGNVIVVRTSAGHEVPVRLPKAFELNLKIRIRGKGDVVLSPGVHNDLIVDIYLEARQESPSFRDGGEGVKGAGWAPTDGSAAYSGDVPVNSADTRTKGVETGSTDSNKFRLVLMNGGIAMALVFTIVLFVFVLGDKDSPAVQEIVSPADLETGACLQDWDDVNSSATVVTCETPHNAQLVASDSFTEDAVFPGNGALEERVNEVCEAVEYSGAAADFQGMKLTKSIPTEQTWASGDRRVDCFVFAPEGEGLTESLLAE